MLVMAFVIIIVCCVHSVFVQIRAFVSVYTFVFISAYFVCFCFILHSCCIIVSAVGWT